MEGIRVLLKDLLGGHRLTDEEAFQLIRTRDRRIWEIAGAADEVRERINGNLVSFVKNQNINVTNICVNACGFCGYSRKPGDADAYFHDEATLREKAALAKSVQQLQDQLKTSRKQTTEAYEEIDKIVAHTEMLLSAGNLPGRKAMLQILETGLRASDPYPNARKLIRLEKGKLAEAEKHT